MKDRAVLLAFLLLGSQHQHLLGVEGGCTSRVGRCLGLLGAGTGFQSCAAPPYRATRWLTLFEGFDFKCSLDALTMFSERSLGAL